jgi:hypothetical protein
VSSMILRNMSSSIPRAAATRGTWK